MIDKIPLARPWIGQEEIDACQRVLLSHRLTGGHEVSRFEDKLKMTCGRSHAISVSNGTVAIELALSALDLCDGEKVLVTAFGFPSAANAIRRRGAIPIPVDVDSSTWLTDFSKAYDGAKDAVGLVAIDQLGLVTEKSKLDAFHQETGLWVLSDAACALGGNDGEGNPGGHGGHISTLSFHPRKNVTTGEGGAILTNDLAMAERISRLRNHGQEKPGHIVEFSTNARLSAIAAGLGCVQVERLATSVVERGLIANGYRERLIKLIDGEKIWLQEIPPGAIHSYQSFAIRLSSHYDRQSVIGKMSERNIETGPSTYAFTEISIHNASGIAPISKKLHDQSLSIPMYNGLRSSELDRVSAELEDILI